MSPRRDWDSPPPLSPASVPLNPEPGGADSAAGEGLGGGGVPIPTTGEKA